MGWKHVVYGSFREKCEILHVGIIRAWTAQSEKRGVHGMGCISKGDSTSEKRTVSFPISPAST